MEEWLILSHVVKYVQYDINAKNFYNLDVKAIDQKSCRKMYDRLKDEGRQVVELDFGENPDKLQVEYLDMYEGVQSEVLSTTRFDENSDLSTTYLGRIDITRASRIKARKVSYIRTRVSGRKAIRWHGLSDTFKQGSKEIIYVQVTF